jgi:hypothetical protein
MPEPLSIQTRRQRFLVELFRLSENSPVPLAQFVKAAGFELKPQGASGADSELTLTERQVKYAIQEVEPRIWPLQVIYEAGNIVLRSSGTAFSRRSDRAADVKMALGTALWDLLLGSDWREEMERPPRVTIAGPEESLNQRIRAFRRRNLLFFAADAGTTTLAVIRQLLQAPRIPLPVSIDFKKSISAAKPGDVRIIDPVLLTNSIPIVNEIANNHKHRHTFHVELVGGTVRANRQCVSGEKSLLWLKACQTLGIANSLDLVILGASGIFVGDDDVVYAACDDPDEAAFKAGLLEMAEGGKNSLGGLRVLVFHAAKLLYPEARCRFSMVNPGMIDLVVVDRGSNEDEVAQVDAFVKAATKAGVATLVVEPGDAD